ncbi:hypothetical protein H0H92_000695, partial [Tricholoma furcatifolium]
MARNGKKKFLEHRTSRQGHARSSTVRNVEHNCYSSRDGVTRSTTNFIKVNVPEKGKVEGAGAASGVIVEELGSSIAYDPAYLEHIVEVDAEMPKRRRTAS